MSRVVCRHSLVNVKDRMVSFVKSRRAIAGIMAKLQILSQPPGGTASAASSANDVMTASCDLRTEEEGGGEEEEVGSIKNRFSLFCKSTGAHHYARTPWCDARRTFYIN